MTKTILCYGDSNTWGYVAGKFNLQTQYMERYRRDIRWTGRLQKVLGDNYYVIEEGLNGRTTNVDSNVPPDRNGKRYLAPCLYSHSPIDLVVMMLGGNDLKNIFNRSAVDIVAGLQELISIIQETKYGSDMQSPPKILLIGYPVLENEIAGVFYGDPDMFKDGIKRSKEFDPLVSELAEKTGCHYFNMAPFVSFSEIDGIHLDEAGHKIFAEKIVPEIKKLFNE